MSLLNDVSIVVTPNGYKAGELYAVVPVPTEGAEEVTNGDFATDSDWDKTGTWSIESNYATSNANGITQYLGQDVGIVNGRTYKITYTVLSNSLNNDRLLMSGTSSFTSIQIPSSIGQNTVYLTASQTPSSGYDVRFANSATNTSGIITLDNVSVKEYTSADMDVTRATAATRVDENGLVNYAEVLGGEEIDNGKFTTNLDSWSTSSWWVWNALGAYHPSTSLHKPLYQQCCVIGKTYLITFDLNCVGSSLAKFSLGSSTGSTTQVIDINLESGSYSYFVTAAAEYIIFNRQNTAEYYVNNVSVKEAARDNVPRIDYTGGGCPHILSEPQRTNLITYSEDFSESAWTKTRCTIDSGGHTSPSGESNAFKMTATDDDARLQDGSEAAGVVYTQSIYVKSATGSDVSGQVDFTGTQIQTFTATSEWQRVDTTSDDTRAGVVRVRITNSGDELYIWGAQLEVGSYPTSYIPTSGSTVTRNQDTFTRDGIGSLINDSEGVLFAEISRTEDESNYRLLGLDNGTSQNYIKIGFGNNNGNFWILAVVNGVTVINSTNAVSNNANQFYKIAVRYKSGDSVIYIDGVPVLTSSTTFSSGTFTDLDFTHFTGSSHFFGKVKQLQVYNTALTDEQLTSLTS